MSKIQSYRVRSPIIGRSNYWTHWNPFASAACGFWDTCTRHDILRGLCLWVTLSQANYLSEVLAWFSYTVLLLYRTCAARSETLRFCLCCNYWTYFNCRAYGGTKCFNLWLPTASGHLTFCLIVGQFCLGGDYDVSWQWPAMTACSSYIHLYTVKWLIMGWTAAFVHWQTSWEETAYMQHILKHVLCAFKYLLSFLLGAALDCGA